MGAGASSALQQTLPLEIDKATARKLSMATNTEFDEAAFDSAAIEGSVPRERFLTSANVSDALMSTVVAELSAARTNPKALADAIRLRLSMFKGNVYHPPDRGGKVAVPSKEGKKAVAEAVAFLEKQPALGPLAEPARDVDLQSLRLSCEDHLHGVWTGLNSRPSSQRCQDFVTDGDTPCGDARPVRASRPGRSRLAGCHWPQWN